MKDKRVENQERKTIYLVTDTSWWLDQGWRIATEVAGRLKDGEAFFSLSSSGFILSFFSDISFLP